MFSGKFNFLKTIISTIASGIVSGFDSYLTLDYAYQGQPFVNIFPSGSTSITNNSQLCSLDYSYQASPFYANNTTLLNTSNPIVNSVIVDPNPDPYWSNVSLLIRGSGTHGSTTITDSSSYNHSITLPTAGGTNNAAISSGSYVFNNGSIFFDGDYDYLQLPTHSSLDFGSGNFTIEFWMEIDGTQDGGATLFSRYASAANLTQFVINGANLGFGNGSKITSIGSYSQGIMNNSNWHHVAVTRSETSGNFIGIFLDGALVGASNRYSGDNMSMSAGRIGRWQGNDLTDNNYRGYLSEIRLTKGINRYPITKDFTAPTSTYPTGVNDPYWNNVSLLLNFNGSNGSTTFTDSSPNKKILTTNGNAIISTSQSKFDGSSFYFDGTGDYITTPANNDFIFGTSDYTVELWIYLTSLGPGINLFTTAGVVSNFNWNIRSDGQLEHWNGSATMQFGRTSAVPLNQWTHIAFARRNLILSAYINGLLVGCRSENTSLVNNAVVSIGATVTYPNSSIGYMDDLRVTKGVARYTVGSFTPPRLRFAGA